MIALRIEPLTSNLSMEGTHLVGMVCAVQLQSDPYINTRLVCNGGDTGTAVAAQPLVHVASAAYTTWIDGRVITVLYDHSSNTYVLNNV